MSIICRFFVSPSLSNSHRAVQLDGADEVFITSIMGKDFGDQQHSKQLRFDGHHETCNIDFKLELPASIFTSSHPLSQVGILWAYSLGFE